MNHVVMYNKKTDGKTMLSKNFRVFEFACNDGSDIVFIDPLLVWILQNVRDHFKKPVTITSAYRTAAYNDKIGGASGSYHVMGMAADIVVKDVPASDVQKYLELVMPENGGIGKAANYTHVDTRDVKSRWTY